MSGIIELPQLVCVTTAEGVDVFSNPRRAAIISRVGWIGDLRDLEKITTTKRRLDLGGYEATVWRICASRSETTYISFMMIEQNQYGQQAHTSCAWRWVWIKNNLLRLCCHRDRMSSEKNHSARREFFVAILKSARRLQVLAVEDQRQFLLSCPPHLDWVRSVQSFSVTDLSFTSMQNSESASHLQMP